MLDLLLWFLPAFGNGASGAPVAPLAILVDEIRDVSPACEVASLAPTVLLTPHVPGAVP